MSPSEQKFLQDIATNDSLINATDPNSSSGQELALVLHGTNHGKAYTGTPGHFTCP